MIVLLGIFFVGIAIDIFYFQVPSDFRYILLILLWLLIGRVYRKGSEVTFTLAIGFLFLLFIFFIFARGTALLDKITTWVYLTMLIGILQHAYELRGKIKL